MCVRMRGCGVGSNRGDSPVAPPAQRRATLLAMARGTAPHWQSVGDEVRGKSGQPLHECAWSSATASAVERCKLVNEEPISILEVASATGSSAELHKWSGAKMSPRTEPHSDARRAVSDAWKTEGVAINGHMCSSCTQIHANTAAAARVSPQHLGHRTPKNSHRPGSGGTPGEK